MDISLWGLGLAVVGLGVRWFFPTVPKVIAGAVILGGVGLMATELVFPAEPPLIYSVFGAVGILPRESNQVHRC